MRKFLKKYLIWITYSVGLFFGYATGSGDYGKAVIYATAVITVSLTIHWIFFGELFNRKPKS